MQFGTLPKFRFEVDFGTQLKIAFQEVSGMDKKCKLSSTATVTVICFDNQNAWYRAKLWQCHHETQHLCE